MPSDIKTAVDSLIDLLKKKKRISLDDASRELKIPTNIINEWASFLEEEKILKVEYKFTTPYLIYNDTYSGRSEQRNQEMRDVKKDSSIDIIKKRLEGILAFVRRQEIKHKCEIKELADINRILSDGKDKDDVLYAQKKYLEYELTKLINEIRNIKDREKIERDVRKVLIHYETFRKKL
ncbi:MAG: hypothetical protein V1663_03590 [archaeon]